MANYLGKPQPAQRQSDRTAKLLNGPRLFEVQTIFQLCTASAAGHTPLSRPRYRRLAYHSAHVKVVGFAACPKCQQDIISSGAQPREIKQIFNKILPIKQTVGILRNNAAEIVWDIIDSSRNGKYGK